MTTQAGDRIGGSDSPTNLGDFKRYPLLFGPSPVHRLDRLSSHLGGAALWANCDEESWERALADVEASGGKPYAIPAGASDHRLGGLGFAN